MAGKGKQMELPTWALIPMWAATLVGAYFLTHEVLRRAR